MPQSNHNESNRNMMRYAGMATQWMVMLGIAVWAGLEIDERTGWRFPLFTVLLPLIAIFVSLWKLIKSFNKPGK